MAKSNRSNIYVWRFGIFFTTVLVALSVSGYVRSQIEDTASQFTLYIVSILISLAIFMPVFWLANYKFKKTRLPKPDDKKDEK